MGSPDHRARKESQVLPELKDHKAHPDRKVSKGLPGQQEQPVLQEVRPVKA